MTTDNLIMVLSALIVAIGWYVTSKLEQRNEIAKELRSYRLDMLHSFYPILFFLQKKMNGEAFSGQDVKDLETLLAGARSKFLLYGKHGEIEAYENLVAAFLTENNHDKIACLNKLADIVRAEIRAELFLPAHILPVK